MLRRLHQPDVLGQVLGAGAVRSVEPPREADGPLHERRLQRVAGRVVGRPGVAPLAVFGLILPGEDEGLGVEAVLQGVHLRA
jgi:hypothetical protein